MKRGKKTRKGAFALFRFFHIYCIKGLISFSVTNNGAHESLEERCLLSLFSHITKLFFFLFQEMLEESLEKQQDRK